VPHPFQPSGLDVLIGETMIDALAVQPTQGYRRRESASPATAGLFWIPYDHPLATSTFQSELGSAWLAFGSHQPQNVAL
jgi:hypothetical protein